MSEKKDLTRLEDLSEYLHEEDPDVDAKLGTATKSKKLNLPDSSAFDSEETSDEQETSETPPQEFQFDSPEVNYSSETPEEINAEINAEQTADFNQNSDFTEEESPPPSLESIQEENFSVPDEGHPPSSLNEDPLSESLQENTPDENASIFSEHNQIEESDPTSSEITIAPPNESHSFEKIEEETKDRPDTTHIFNLSNTKGQEAQSQSSPLQEIRQFAAQVSPVQTEFKGAMSSPGNPPYALMIRNIKYEEDAEDIISLLSEYGVINDSNREAFTKGIYLGHLLISQLGEFAAVFLAHKFRRFDLEIFVGEAQSLHPSQSYTPDTPLLKKEHLFQNHEEAFDFEQMPTKVEDIILSNTSTLEGRYIHSYKGLISKHALVSEEELLKTCQDPQDHKESEWQGAPEIYKDLAYQLRHEAMGLKANGVVGLNFQMTPLTPQNGINMYKITCLGTAVSASKTDRET